MANAVATIRIMPESPETNLKKIESESLKKIASFAGKGDTRVEIIPVAFGLRSVNITFVMDEKLGSPEPVVKAIEKIKGVNSVETIDVRRAVG